MVSVEWIIFTLVSSHLSNNHLLAAVTMYPPNDCCTNNTCLKKVPLKKEIQKKTVVYTKDVGTQPTYAIHVYCPSKPWVNRLSIPSQTLFRVRDNLSGPIIITTVSRLASEYTTLAFQISFKLGSISMWRTHWQMVEERRCYWDGEKSVFIIVELERNDDIAPRFSATNASRLYDYMMTDQTYFQSSEWGA